MTAIIGILIEDKRENVGKVQEILSEFCCDIRTRLGINDYDKKMCASRGIVLIDVPRGENADKIKTKLNSIQNVTIKEMVF